MAASIEAGLSNARLLELRERPVRGNFDRAHLLEIHRRIFSDMPEAGLSGFDPGQMRPSVPGWVKSRGLTTKPVSYEVGYSKMDEVALTRLDEALASLKPDQLREMPPAVATKAIAALYGELDYVHPFKEGNSRTLREFTRQMAQESGYTLQWERLGQTVEQRDILYIARDRTVLEKFLPTVTDPRSLGSVVATQHRLSPNRDLEKLLEGHMQPTRALKFEAMERIGLHQQDPEMAPLAKLLDEAERSLEREMPDRLDRSRYMTTLTDTIRRELNEKAPAEVLTTEGMKVSRGASEEAQQTRQNAPRIRH